MKHFCIEEGNLEDTRDNRRRMLQVTTEIALLHSSQPSLASMTGQNFTCCHGGLHTAKPVFMEQKQHLSLKS